MVFDLDAVLRLQAHRNTQLRLILRDLEMQN